MAGAQAPPVQPPPASAPPAAKHKSHASQPQVPDAKPLSEDDLRPRLQNKRFFLRGGYSGNDLRFDSRGALSGSSPKTSYTLNLVAINKVHLGKRQLQLEGIRYGIHFTGEDPKNDPIESSEKLRITPKKKVLKISIARAEPSKKKKSRSKDEANLPASAVTTQATANRMLLEAVDRVLARDIDEHMIASLPDYWQFFFRAVAAKSPYKPSDPSVLRQSAVDRKARLLSNFDPPSNDLAQNAGIVGMAQYHVVVGPDGRSEEIAVSRPIGFGLDESAIDYIRKATFQPALKDGKPVPVLLDLMVQFRIFSKRTGVMSNEASATLAEPEAPPLPGPYSASQPAAKPPQ
jgi:TonB family protein